MNKELEQLKSGRPLFLLTILALLLASVFFYDNVYLPQREKLAEKKLELIQKQKQTQIIVNFMKEHSDLPAYEKELKKKVDGVRVRFPSAMDLSEFVESIQSLALKNGVVIKAIKPEKPLPSGKYFIQRLRVEFRSPFLPFAEFFAALEREERFFRVTALNMTADEVGVLNGYFDLNIYSFSLE